MLAVNFALDKLQEQLEDRSALKDLGISISQNEQVNENINYAPWLGIYTREVRHDPKTLATTQRRWKGIIKLVLVIQAVHLKSGRDCGRLLEQYIQEIVNAIINDTTFGQSIDMVNNLVVEYSYDKNNSETLYFQEAFVTLEVETEHENS